MLFSDFDLHSTIKMCVFYPLDEAASSSAAEVAPLASFEGRGIDLIDTSAHLKSSSISWNIDFRRCRPRAGLSNGLAALSP